MAALPASNTKRLKIRYQNALDEHSVTFRVNAIATEPEISTAVDNFVTALGGLIYLSVIIAVEQAAAGSNIFLPRASFSTGTSVGVGTVNTVTRTDGLSFPGRTSAGRRAKIYPLGCRYGGDNNFRYTATELTQVGAFIALLNSNAGTLFVGVDELPVTWYNYCTYKQNDHYVNLSRGT